MKEIGPYKGEMNVEKLLNFQTQVKLALKHKAIPKTISSDYVTSKFEGSAASW